MFKNTITKTFSLQIDLKGTQMLTSFDYFYGCGFSGFVQTNNTNNNFTEIKHNLRIDLKV